MPVKVSFPTIQPTVFENRVWVHGGEQGDTQTPGEDICSV